MGASFLARTLGHRAAGRQAEALQTPCRSSSKSPGLARKEQVRVRKKGGGTGSGAEKEIANQLITS